MDIRHSTTSGLKEEQEPAAGVDARHGTTSELEEEQESAAGMDARHHVQYWKESRSVPQGWIPNIV